MEPNNYAYYNIETGLIENIIWVTEDVAPTLIWPDGYAIVDIPDSLVGEWSACGIGWSYIDGKFIEPENPAPISLPKDTNQPIVDGAQSL